MYSVNHWLLRLTSGESDSGSPPPAWPRLCWPGEPAGCSSARGSARPTTASVARIETELRQRFDEAAETLGEIADRATETRAVDSRPRSATQAARPAVRCAFGLVASWQRPKHRHHRVRPSRRRPARVGGTRLGSAPGPHRRALSAVRGASRPADPRRAAHRSRTHGARSHRHHRRRAGLRGRPPGVRIAEPGGEPQATTRSSSRPPSCPFRCVRALRTPSRARRTAF